MQRIEVIQADITKLEVDAIVNAANSSLLGGGGVDGAIHRVAGPELGQECKLLGGCKTGEAKITKGYNLPAKYVIHTVGPVWNGGNNGEAVKLESCYKNALLLTEKYNLQTVAFPAISTGIYGYPLKEGAEIAFRTVKLHLETNNLPQKVYFVCFGEENYNIYVSLVGEQ